MVASDTMNIAKRFTSIFAVVAVSALLGAAVPAASAGGAMADTTVTATRSFPKTTAAKRDFLAEHTSTDVESNADWGWHRKLGCSPDRVSGGKGPEGSGAG